MLDQMDLKDIYRTFHPKAVYTFFSSAHGTFSREDHRLGHKTSINKFEKTEILLSIFSDQSDTKLEINYGKKTGKLKNLCKLNNMLLNHSVNE